MVKTGRRISVFCPDPVRARENVLSIIIYPVKACRDLNDKVVEVKKYIAFKKTIVRTVRILA
jgi:hypothetical protein